jgi:hypothetical protein
MRLFLYFRASFIFSKEFALMLHGILMIIKNCIRRIYRLTVYFFASRGALKLIQAKPKAS